MLNDVKIGFIGTGVMGEAMVRGMLDKALVEPEQIIASDAREERVREIVEWYDIRGTTDNCEAASQADILVLAVKPQALGKVLDELRGSVKPTAMVLSIVAGAKIRSIGDGLAHAAVVRTMPNTPAQIGQGITVWAATPQVSATQLKQAEAILSALGEHVQVDDEDYLDMATALSGTGPAYVFLFMEALIDAGVHLGFPRHVAEKLVMQTMRGSVEYAEYSTKHPARLRNQVTSPGGTSAEALYHLEKGGLRTVISRAVWAAYQRSVALGGGVPKGRLGGRSPEGNDQSVDK
ncbi:MAG: pyrroline-5-carboxylate reductase [Anaerolineae bacterium]|nr:pyrroline-5-carboxylate reductase [Anaerolineae bacterium]